MCLAETSG